ncbi:regulatory LuxR family protein [Tenacibaculum skagerrakense]|uniref:Regulatory LuxR family protein n=1 Tax=Tenacibaculum skagerrakense TaxID=186571 RepID=A0A4R2P2A3_9FLAO|nr:response regulator transcription factor [Tenacibaculum skagerrakense]TCP28238.1 regulatory LuxR family protein [Tenacibaculum skagerrakense]
MKKTIFVFSALIIALLVLFQISKYSIISGGIKTELVITSIAVVAFFIGAIINKKAIKPSEETTSEINHQKIKELEITSREYEVLALIAKGFSNKEIAATLFLSKSTIKTHVSNLLNKLNAKRRTQAIQIAKELEII